MTRVFDIVRPEPAVAPAPAPATPRPETAEVLGVPLALTDYDETLDWIDATVVTRGKGYICVAAVHTVMA